MVSLVSLALVARLVQEDDCVCFSFLEKFSLKNLQISVCEFFPGVKLFIVVQCTVE